MSSKRYAVLDKNGVKVNTILIDDPFPAGYWPGYGAYLVCEDGDATGTENSRLEVLKVAPDKPVQTGDIIDIATGVVAKRQIEFGTETIDGEEVQVAKAVDVNYSKLSAEAKEAETKK